MGDKFIAEAVVEISCLQLRTIDCPTFSRGNKSLDQSVVFMVYSSRHHHLLLCYCELILICKLLFALRTRGGEVLL
jgi:hypothetical protein